jgi:hypothetical protein
MARVRRGWLVVVVFGFIAACCQAAEAQNMEMKVISSDATPETRSIQLGLNKSVVIELPRDVKNVLLSGNANIASGAQQHPYPVTVLPLTKRRMSIIGTNVGAGSIYFYGENDQPIGGLVVYVLRGPQFPPRWLEGSSLDTEATLIHVQRGSTQGIVFCKPGLGDDEGCGYPIPEDEPSNTTHSDIHITGEAVTPSVNVGSAGR